MPLNLLQKKLKEKLESVYILSSEELFLLQLGRDLIISEARSQGFQDKYTFSVEGADFDWSEVRAVCDNMSLFGSQQIIDLRFLTDSIGKEGAKFLEFYCDQGVQNTDNLLILSLLEYNIQKKETYRHTKATWFKSVATLTKPIELPVPNRENLTHWLNDRLKVYHLTATSDALEFLAEHVEGNLFAGEQEIIKLNLSYGDNPPTLTKTDIEKAIIHVAEYSLEELSESLLTRDYKRSIYIIETLISEEYNIVYLAMHITRDVRQLISFIKLQRENRNTNDIFRTLKVWQNERKNLLTKAVRLMNPNILVNALKQSFIVDKTIKGLEPHRNTRDELIKLVLILSH